MSASLEIEATTAEGEVLPRIAVGHGEQPEVLLYRAGWQARWIDAVAEGQTVVLRYQVSTVQPPVPYRRIAAYALVIEEINGQECVLLTSFTNDKDTWGLPGGGVDPGEAPLEGVVREVWEESGQHISEIDPITTTSDHWVGSSPAGRFEDYNAVRLLYLARCAEPIEPVIHDVGGSTDQAQWVPIAEALSRRLVPFTRKLIEGWQRR
ncbi:NUDIX domain-containing protein [Ornithinimicrobium sp. Arc0846-15]|nr:NUDIX domain-containing protein [Ornithinimicrobium laminariae]